MAVARRRSSMRSFRRAPQRKRVWARASNEGAELVAGGSAGSPTTVNLLSDFETVAGLQVFGITVVRILGEIFVAAGEEPAADVQDFMACAWGIKMTPASTVTTAVSPLDVDAQGAYEDWMGFGVTHLLTTGDTTIQASGAFDGAGYHRFPVDVRSKRKLDELGTSLALHFDSAPETTSWCFYLSMLLLLP